MPPSSERDTTRLVQEAAWRSDSRITILWQAFKSVRLAGGATYKIEWCGTLFEEETTVPVKVRARVLCAEGARGVRGFETRLDCAARRHGGAPLAARERLRRSER